ncbi:hypothetical protein BJY00DRAFT_311282 [Aspergillus carlsbadensis]|nr:hypothetical protein BJY00DRAFT_311282 [Aspergillus carlsbadensis]
MAPANIPTITPPPPGVTPNPNNPHARFRTTNLAIATVGMSLCTVFLVMRIYTKAHLLHRFWLDDVFIIMAWVFSLATQIIILWAYYHAGYGLHAWDFTVPLLTRYMKVHPLLRIFSPNQTKQFLINFPHIQALAASSILYIPSLALAKLALLLLYHSILSPTTPTKTPLYLLYALGAIITAYSIALILALIFACDPLARAWDASVTQGRCINRNAVYMATAVTNTASDVVLLGVAVWIVSRLRMSMGVWVRVGLIFLFGVGGVTTAMSIVRAATLMPQLTSPDKTYGLAEASIYILIEANLIILCACLPYLRQFLRHHAPQSFRKPFPFVRFLKRAEGGQERHQALGSANGADTVAGRTDSLPSGEVLHGNCH